MTFIFSETRTMATVYVVNKGINKSMEFRGLKAQYMVPGRGPGGFAFTICYPVRGQG